MPVTRTSLRIGRACAIRAARCCKRAVMEPCALSLRDNGETRNARPARVSPCGTWREGEAGGQRTFTQKRYALQLRERFTHPPRARNARYPRRRSRHRAMGDGEIVRGAIGEKAWPTRPH